MHGEAVVNGWDGWYRPEHDVNRLRFQLFLDIQHNGFFRSARRRPEHDVKLLPVPEFCHRPFRIYEEFQDSSNEYILFCLSALDRLPRYRTDHQNASTSNLTSATAGSSCKRGCAHSTGCGRSVHARRSVRVWPGTETPKTGKSTAKYAGTIQVLYSMTLGARDTQQLLHLQI